MDPLLRVIGIAFAVFYAMGAPPPAGNWKRLPAADRAACTASGGFVERMGMAGAEGCLHYLKDAGKVCTAKADCQGMCLYQGGQPMPAHPTGLCAPTDSPFGCHTSIDNGKVVGLCVD